jgi:inner membrane protein
VRTRPAVALACLATVAAADWTIRTRRPRWILVGLLDEPAHLATAGLVLVNLTPRSTEWAVGFMAGAALPDLDHVPLALSRIHPSVDDPRPVTHGLLAVSPLAAAALLLRPGPAKDAAAGAAFGTLAHFARDLAVGTGVALFQPFTPRNVKVPYALYAAGLTALALRPLLTTNGRKVHEKALRFPSAYSRSRPSGAAPAHIPGASGRGP